MVLDKRIVDGVVTRLDEASLTLGLTLNELGKLIYKNNIKQHNLGNNDTKRCPRYVFKRTLVSNEVFNAYCSVLKQNTTYFDVWRLIDRIGYKELTPSEILKVI